MAIVGRRSRSFGAAVAALTWLCVPLLGGCATDSYAGESREGRHRVAASLTTHELADAEICPRLRESLSIIYAATPSDCMAYPFTAQASNNTRFVVYDLVINIPQDVAAERGHVGLVDSIELDLIEVENPVRGILTYRLIPAGHDLVAVVERFQRTAHP